VDEIVKEIDLAFVKVENWNQDESFLLDMEAGPGVPFTTFTTLLTYCPEKIPCTLWKKVL